MYETIKVKNTTFLFSPFKERQTAALGIFVKIGSRYEDRKIKGIAHFLEHMLFKGSKKYAYRKMQQEIEGRGGSLNGFTSQELTGYYVRFLNKNIKLTMDILLDMVFYPLLNSTEIEKERQVILEEINMHNDLPSSFSSMQLDKILWPEHALGEDVLGDSTTIAAIKREDFSWFINQYYQPANIIVCCCGDFDRNHVEKILKYNLKDDSKTVNLTLTAPQALNGIHVKIERRPLKQANICLGFRGVSYLSRDNFTAELINVIFGANMSSRLFQEIREKRGLCYDISSEARKYKDTGAFTIHMGLDKSNSILALKTVLNEFNKIRVKGVSAKELERAKDYMLGQIAMGLEKPLGRMFYLAESLLTLGRIYSFEQIREKLKAITCQTIKDYINNRFFKDHFCVSCIGDFDLGMEDIIKEEISKSKIF